MKKWNKYFKLPALVSFAAAITFLAGCASSSGPQPLPLGPAPHLMNIMQTWQTKLSPSANHLSLKAVGDKVVVASSTGNVALLNANNGQVLWQVDLKQGLSTGAGFDGQTAAVVTKRNQLVVMSSGKIIWQHNLPALTLTPPLVAGKRVFVLAADRSLWAFDADNGAQLWSNSSNSNSLILNIPGVLGAYDNTLIAGMGSDLKGYNPITGESSWSIRWTNATGSSDVERLVDLVAGGSFNQSQLCLRSYQNSVGCADLKTGDLIWSKNSVGITGLGGNDKTIFGSDQDGRIAAWSRTDGKHLWQQDQLRFRQLTSPLVLGLSLVVGDKEGHLFFLALDDGSQLLRLSTDGSPIVDTPVIADNTLVVMTQKGDVFGFRPKV